jgi:hypothetical protein
MILSPTPAIRLLDRIAPRRNMFLSRPAAAPAQFARRSQCIVVHVISWLMKVEAQLFWGSPWGVALLFPRRNLI